MQMGQQSMYFKDLPRLGPDFPHSQTPPANFLLGREQHKLVDIHVTCEDSSHAPIFPFLEGRLKPPTLMEDPFQEFHYSL